MHRRPLAGTRGRCRRGRGILSNEAAARPTPGAAGFGRGVWPRRRRARVRCPLHGPAAESSSAAYSCLPGVQGVLVGLRVCVCVCHAPLIICGGGGAAVLSRPFQAAPAPHQASPAPVRPLRQGRSSKGPPPSPSWGLGLGAHPRHHRQPLAAVAAVRRRHCGPGTRSSRPREGGC